MRKTQTFLGVILLTLYSGCSSVNSHEFERRCKIYGGVRDDADRMVHPDVWADPLLGIVDLPFSFIADSLYFPSDLANQPPSVNPVDGWKSWHPWEEESHPALYGFHGTILVNPPQPAKHSPLDQTIKDDYLNYLKQHEPGYFDNGPLYLEDGTGRHAVQIQVGRNGFYHVYIFIYDKSNMRTKVIKYADGGYAC